MNQGSISIELLYFNILGQKFQGRTQDLLDVRQVFRLLELYRKQWRLVKVLNLVANDTAIEK